MAVEASAVAAAISAATAETSAAAAKESATATTVTAASSVVALEASAAILSQKSDNVGTSTIPSIFVSIVAPTSPPYCRPVFLHNEARGVISPLIRPTLTKQRATSEVTVDKPLANSRIGVYERRRHGGVGRRRQAPLKISF